MGWPLVVLLSGAAVGLALMLWNFVVFPPGEGWTPRPEPRYVLAMIVLATIWMAAGAAPGLILASVVAAVRRKNQGSMPGPNETLDQWADRVVKR